jgi:SET domain-containing protein
VRRSAIQGRGVFAKVPIPKGARIIEYTGEHITHAVADERYDDVAMTRHHTFLFTLNRRTVVDGAVGGSDARYINHSCDPNCEGVIDGREIWIEATRDIAQGEELAYDYGYERDGTETAEDEARYACRCGAPGCRGTILAPRKPVARLPEHAKARHAERVAG